jgi:glycosyltransferase involved in cell wall biosynthesis
MRVLVWQWGRRGAGPRFAACLAEALRDRPGIDVTLSLCRDAEIMTGPTAPACEMPVRTYRGKLSFLLRLATLPGAVPLLVRRLWPLRPDLAICAMPGLLDLAMAAALRCLGCRIVVVVHDADLHAGDGHPAQMALQRWLCRSADAIAYLSRHVGARLAAQGQRAKLLPFRHPPFAFDLPAAHRRAGPPRLLCFGRLRAYKGLDLLAAGLPQVPHALEVRVVGQGPECAALDALRTLPGVTVENRWVPEAEIGALLAWSDALVLPYREASQSGVAAAALAAGRPVIATRVGGLREQLAEAPQAVLCEPDAASLARAIGLWLEAPADPQPRTDTAQAWRDAATDLLAAIGSALPPARRRAGGGFSVPAGTGAPHAGR